eukprot:m.101278 g.101278  ORF g.101278 m.101278 type:complete len:794 (-) comp14087_c0_seq2:78-2459(-)
MAAAATTVPASTTRRRRAYSQGDSNEDAAAEPQSWLRQLASLFDLQSRIPPHRRLFGKQEQFESLDYEESENVVDIQAYQQQSHRMIQKIFVLRWFIMFLIGVCTALVGIVVDLCVLNISTWKFGMLSSVMQGCVGSMCLFGCLFAWAGINIAFTSVANFCAHLEPIAQGSGIPEIKCYLNGIKMPHVVRLKTLATKVVGTVAAVAGGLMAGKEGPMIHAGSVIAAGVSQGKSSSLRFLNFRIFGEFRTDFEKRDFVAGGAAAGVAAAFGAPIGGVLFSIEEGASFWSQPLTWRIFFCSMTSTFTLNFLLSGFREGTWGELSNPGLINFGKFTDLPYTFYEMPFFVLLGVIGGLLGALFIELNKRLTLFRRKFVNTPKIKLIEVAVVTLVTTSIAFLFIIVSSECLSVTNLLDANGLQLDCPDGQYSAAAQLAFNTLENTVKSLFHDSKSNFSAGLLAFYFVLYFPLALWTYGLAVPSGLFVPSFVLGSALGRLFGTVLHIVFPATAWADPGKYALIGAAAFLGGVVRMALSVTVIMIEATGNVTFGLPIMLAVISAKIVGDLFNTGIYDTHIELKHIPLLSWDAPEHARWRLHAADIMTREPVCVETINSVASLYYLLNNSRHSAFPVVANPAGRGPRQLLGMVLRTQLVVVLKRKAFGHLNEDGTVTCPILTQDDFRSAYPRWPTIEQIQLTPSDFGMYIDLQPYMNTSPYVCFSSSSLNRVFRLFRTMGLRHLAVIDHDNTVVGIITRKDLANIRPEMTREEFTVIEPAEAVSERQPLLSQAPSSSPVFG